MTVYGLEIGTYEAFNKDIKKCLDFVYLHGVLEDKNGFDLLGVDRKTYNSIHSNPICITKVNVVFHNGDKEEGILFFWHDGDGREHGLIVSETDKESMDYAKEKFDNRAYYL